MLPRPVHTVPQATALGDTRPGGGLGRTGLGWLGRHPKDPQNLRSYQLAHLRASNTNIPIWSEMSLARRAFLSQDSAGHLLFKYSVWRGGSLGSVRLKTKKLGPSAF